MLRATSSVLALLTCHLTAAVPLGAQTPPEPVSRDFPQGRVLAMIGPGVAWGRQTRFFIVRIQAVKEDLALSSNQAQRLTDAVASYEKEVGRAAQESRNALRELAVTATPEEYRAAQQRNRDRMLAMESRAEEDIGKILDKSQRTRLDQILLQIEGPYAFQRPEVQTRVNIFPEQLVQILAIANDGSQRLFRDAAPHPALLPGNRPPTAEEWRAVTKTQAYKDASVTSRKIALNVRDDTMNRIMKVLSKTQRARYEAMVGKPFDMTKYRQSAWVPGAAPRS